VSRPLYRTRVKFCGLTRPGDVRLAGELGVDAVGFVFAQGSRRRVEIDAASAMTSALAPLVDAVALFMDNDVDEVREVVRQVRPSLLQFHGSEDDAFCRSFGVPYIKAMPMAGGDALDPLSLHARYPAAAGFLLDGHAPGASGGTGRAFDWAQVPKGMTKPFLLAGGLTPDNVFDAVVTTLPWGVDVSTGIEVDGEPGVKDGARMRKFVEEVRRADCD
jgi:phosphoribosylanthranilate isomerase